MPPFSARTNLYIVADVVLLVVCFLNAPSVLERARLPFHILTVERSIIISSVDQSSSAGGLHVGDRILKWEQNDAVLPEMFEVFGDLYSVGKKTTIEYQRGTAIDIAIVSLIPYYDSLRFLIVTLCVGVIIWAIGIIVLIYKSQNFAATILHWGLMALAGSTMLTWGRIEPLSFFPLLARALFFACYTMTPALFFLFTLKFPHDRQTILSRNSFWILLPALVLIVEQTYYHVQAIQSASSLAFVSFQRWFNAFNLYLFLLVGATIFNLIHSYRSAVRIEEKKKLQWILWGFCVSPIPFLLFIKLPQLFGIPEGIIPEELTTIFFLSIPFSCAISVIRYDAADIHLLINRSVLYSALTIFIGIIYALTVWLTATSFGAGENLREYTFIGLALVIVGYLLNPLRKHTQKLIDELLFPARASFRTTSAAIRKQLQECLTTNDIYSTLAEKMKTTFSFEKFSLYRYSGQNLILTASNVAGAPKFFHCSEEESSEIQKGNIVALPSAINFQRDDISIDNSALLKKLRCALCIPLAAESNTVLGIAGGTPSKTSGSFTEEEIDLLAAMCGEAAEAISRLAVQEQMIIQNEEKRRLEEVSNLKSYFVSSVSHEMRTPLTSIRMFAEMLRGKTLPKKKQHEYLEIVEGESGRLSRLVENVLDFAVIERGQKEYHFETADVSEVVKRRAGIIAIKHPRAKEIFQELNENRIIVSLREGALRIAPHFYAADEDVDVLFSILRMNVP